MPIDLEQARKDQDARRRRDLLESLYIIRGSSPTGGVNGVELARLAECNGVDRRFEDERHALTMIEDLVMRGYVTKTTRLIRRGERFGLRHVALVKITDKGANLYNELIDPDPLVWDERVSE